MNAIEVTILGGPFDGTVRAVRAGSPNLRLEIRPPMPADDGESWVAYYGVDIPIHLTRNGYRADWASRRSTTTTGDTP
jgi:hypothetical protein